MTTRFASPLGSPPTWGVARIVGVLQKLLENWKAVRVAITKVLADLLNVSQRLMTEPHGESIVETGGSGQGCRKRQDTMTQTVVQPTG